MFVMFDYLQMKTILWDHWTKHKFRFVTFVVFMVNLVFPTTVNISDM